LPTALLSTGVAKYSTKSSCETAVHIQSLQPFCGLIISEDMRCTCWLYVAPYGYDSGVYHGLEAVLRFFNLPERIAVYAALRLENEDLEIAKQEFLEMFKSKDDEVSFNVCGSGDDSSHACRIDLDGFPEKARLLQWSFRLNSWSGIKRSLNPPAFSLGNISAWAFALLATLALVFRQTSRKKMPRFADGSSFGGVARS